MSDVTIRATDVHITYRTYIDPAIGLRERLKTAGRKQRRYRDIYAVRGVSLDLHEGEALGVIGANGAGKSTLMQGLAGLLTLDQGEVLARSRPTLLAVGAGLDPQLSGRRNIEVGCLALGMRRREIAQQMENSIEFSGLRDFIDVPMRAYSQGMRARLAFTIATVASSDILLIDEALAVGDASFRERAAQRLESIRDAAGSVIVVSHNLREIQRMCTRVIWLDGGRVQADGPPERIIARYREAVE